MIEKILTDNISNAKEEILKVNEDNQYINISNNNISTNITYDDNGNIIQYKDKYHKRIKHK